MRRLLLALPLLALVGCGSAYKFGRHRASPPAPTPLTEQEKASWNQRWAEDWAHCTERGYALQTYSGGWSAYEGSGGGHGATQFNSAVFVSCMEARGWPYEGRTPTLMGVKLGS